MFSLVLNNKVPAIILGLALLCVVKFALESNKQPIENASLSIEEYDKVHGETFAQKGEYANSETHNHDHEHDGTDADLNRNPSSVTAKITYSFKDEVKKVNHLSKNYPHSKPQLIEMITDVDPFKAQKKEVKPHTSDELLQRKIGAVKVLALKALMSKELNKDNLKRDLISIARDAKDPTITQIANAALKSVEDDRSLFDDLPDAIDDQTLPE